jgi:two-component system phosphate regulon response regulator OmpR
VRAVLRRRGSPAVGAAAPLQGGKVTFGPFTLDLATRQLTRDGENLPLTSGELVLKVLVEHARRPLSRDQLMELARGREHEAFDRAIDVQISRLRKMIEDGTGQPRYIQTVWGFGYVFVPDGERSA